MKKNSKMNRTYISIVAIIAIAVCATVTVQAQTKRQKDKRNVYDYYKILPENNNLLSSSILKSKDTKVVIKDTKNGYLKIEGAFEGWIEVALFRRRNGSAVVVVGENTCGPVCGTDLSAYELIEGKLQNITEKVLPKITEDEVREIFRRNRKDPNAEMVSFLYVLPRYGMRIKINEDVSGELIYEIKWEDDMFEVIR
jgi:hypothetical protein